MSEQQLAALRTLATTVAAQDPAYAVSEYERAAISMAHSVLQLLDELQRLQSIATPSGRTLLHPFHNTGD